MQIIFACLNIYVLSRESRPEKDNFERDKVEKEKYSEFQYLEFDPYIADGLVKNAIYVSCAPYKVRNIS